MTRRFYQLAVLLARFGLSAGYLSAVADRFGAWGRPGAPGVRWGDFQRFVTQVEAIPLMPPGWASVFAWIATVLEASLGLSLLVGMRTRATGFASGCLLLVFAVATALSPGTGIHAVFASSLLSAAGASMLLATRAGGG